ncbi:Uncharacterized protein dnm_017840 [Desulfonema magnum]|uniref:Uncharacterized protein n=1 Tax=Desulfonema magnum TaxID=45655 RepID=A0A975GLM2_9BACT|nr:Uncharacterized protein dnm_017840 [Desulfonema magnum]
MTGRIRTTGGCANDGADGLLYKYLTINFRYLSGGRNPAFFPE